jgi:hypothetical protein
MRHRNGTSAVGVQENSVGIITMADASANKADWVRRVLGIDVSIAPGAAPAARSLNSAAADWRKAREQWQDAIDAVDGQIAALQAVLNKTDDDELAAIAKFGMNGLTGGHKVKLTAAMMELGGGDRSAMLASGPKVRKLAEEFRKHIETDGRVGACDDNPFGVTVAIRTTLGPALAALVATVDAGMRS